MKIQGLVVISCLLAFSGEAFSESAALRKAKRNLVAVAQSFQGQGDPDFRIQNQLEEHVDEVLRLAPPQKPIAERLSLLAGTWKQVWGPYDYRNSDRGVDPQLEAKEIYQYVSLEGYYYNVSPLYKNGDKSKLRIGLLRGRYKLSKDDPNGLDVRFTRYVGFKGRPVKRIWDLAPLVEAGPVKNQITIVPAWIVKLFFGGGTLIEIYTDKDLRLLYGVGSDFDAPYLYVMTRVH